MCWDCWTQEGSPKLNTPEIVEAAAMAAELNEFGALHIILADFNIDDDDVAFCRSLADELTEGDARFLDLLEPMSIEERASCLGLADGYWEVRDVPDPSNDR